MRKAILMDLIRPYMLIVPYFWLSYNLVDEETWYEVQHEDDS